MPVSVDDKMVQKNKSMLSCPSCSKPLVNIASRVERVHPVARFVNAYNVWIMVVVSGILLTLIVTGVFGYDRFIGFAVIISVIFPHIIMFFLIRCFKIYRVTECPYCKYYEEQELGYSHTPG